MINRYFAVSVVVCVAGSTMLVLATCDALYLREQMMGWALAVANVFIAVVINRRAMVAKRKAAATATLVLNGMRLLLLILVLFLVRLSGMANFQPFLIAAVMGYGCFMFSEVLTIYKTCL